MMVEYSHPCMEAGIQGAYTYKLVYAAYTALLLGIPTYSFPVIILPIS